MKVQKKNNKICLNSLDIEWKLWMSTKEKSALNSLEIDRKLWGLKKKRNEVLKFSRQYLEIMKIHKTNQISFKFNGNCLEIMKGPISPCVCSCQFWTHDERDKQLSRFQISVVAVDVFLSVTVFAHLTLRSSQDFVASNHVSSYIRVLYGSSWRWLDRAWKVEWVEALRWRQSYTLHKPLW